jgi:dihydroorotate dehydrogenase (NAD+) catalytic subunit
VSVDARVSVGGLELKNPLIAGSGEATMDRQGIMSALEVGVAAVVAKSTNESRAAKAQLDAAEYVLLDENWAPLPWGPAPRTASLFCRSGLTPQAFEDWLGLLVECDGAARDMDAFVIASLIVADPAECVETARAVCNAGIRWLELNLGPPHGEEAPAGAIRSESEAAVIEQRVRSVRSAIDIPLTVKLSGQGDLIPLVMAARAGGADAVCLAGRHLGFLPDVDTRRPVLGTFGAIGGAWALPLTLRWVAKARSAAGPGLSLIGTNGARNGLDVIRFLLAGASAVEMTSAYLTDGPEALARTREEVERYLEEAGLSAREIVGEAADHVLRYDQVPREGVG